MASPADPVTDRQFGDVTVPVLVVMAGLPGGGKSTIAQVLGARLNATIVSVDPIESSILHAGIDADQPTGLAAYLVAETMAEQVLMSGRTVIVDAVNAVEQSLEDYQEWKGASAAMPRITLDTVRPLGENIQAALEFIER
jgi:adenylylsulfate kinase-like enzyme